MDHSWQCYFETSKLDYALAELEFFSSDSISSNCWFIVFKILVLKDAMLTMFLHISKLGSGSVADFSNTGTRAPTSAECTPYLAL